MKKTISILLLSVLFVLCVSAHPGRTDENGGHWDRKNGTYHFHDGRYAGKDSSGSSSNSVYTPFTPPYEPPTENPYRNDSNSQFIIEDIEDDEELKTSNTSPKDVITTVITFVICFFLSVFIVVAFFYIKCMDGCLYLSLYLLGIYFGFPVLIVSYISEPIISLQCTIVLLPITAICLFVIILLHKVNNAIKDYEATLSYYESAVDVLVKHLEALPLNVSIPSNYEIGNDNLPKERDAKNWGLAFTLYKSNYGKKLHFKKACSNARTKIHLYQVKDYIHIKDMLCTICSRNYNPPDLEWYEDYLKQQKAQNEYDVAFDKVLSLKEQALNRYKRFSPALFKLVLQFSKKKREKVKQLRNQHDKITLRYLESQNEYIERKNLKNQ